MFQFLKTIVFIVSLTSMSPAMAQISNGQQSSGPGAPSPLTILNANSNQTASPMSSPLRSGSGTIQPLAPLSPVGITPGVNSLGGSPVGSMNNTNFSNRSGLQAIGTGRPNQGSAGVQIH
jgi:hypothetical protein